MSVKHYRNYINGVWKDAKTAKRRDVLNPADGTIIATIADSGRDDAADAIKSAGSAFYDSEEWRNMNPPSRADALFEIARAIQERRDEIAELECMNNGKPLREAEADVDDTAACFKYYAGLIGKPSGNVYDVSDAFGPMQSFTVHEPVGVCGLIAPWNYPLLMAAWKIAPSLAAGNCIVFKPASVTPISSAILFEIIDKIGIPAGVANLVFGPGSSVGQELAESTDVDMVAFTGSTEVGRGIALAATKNLKKVGLELGGKSPNIIFADADLEGAVEWAMVGIFMNQGQICSAGSRILVEASFKDAFLARFKERAEAMTIGNPLKNPDLGPLVSKEQKETVLRYIEIGKKEGAVCVCGGSSYDEGDCKNGFYVRPTIFDNCTQDMRIVQEEIFGPVVTIQTFRDEAEAVALANDNMYGLAGAVFTTDGARALRVIRALRAGITWINCYNPTYVEAPWGGYKMSGIGRELGQHGFTEYQEIKQININLNPGPLGWYENRQK
jgi:betaine-aldehyde dehydrogenase